MLRNYLKIAIRNLAKYKAYSFINILGLAVGMTCCLLIAMYIQDELGYDRFFDKSDRIYRLEVDIYPPTGAMDHYAVAGGSAVGPLVERDYPEIERAIRFRRVTQALIQRGSDQFYETFHFTDSTVFEVFNFTFIAGDPQTALKDLYSLVLTERMSEKYFGDSDPLGKTLTIDDSIQFKITGVIENVPRNSHMSFDFLGSLATLPQLGYPGDSWWRLSYHTYVLLAENTDVAALAGKLHRLSANYIPDQETGSGYRQEHFLQPVTDIHLNSDKRSEWQPNNKMAYIYIFGIIATLTLLIACINFMNLTTARSMERAKEVGIRKVVGARRFQLTRQFLGESMILAGISALLAVGLVELLSPYFNDLTGKQLNFSILNEPFYLLVLILTTFIVGALAGIYPAAFLSSFRPVETIKGKFKAGARGAILRKALVVCQFGISIILIISTAVVYNQLSFMRDKDLGFNKSQIIILPTRSDNDIRQQYDVLKNAFAQNTAVFNTTIASSIPGRAFNNSVFKTEGNNVGSEYGTDNWNDMRFINVREEFKEMYKLELLAGRFFSESHESDIQSGFVLNEAAIKKFGWNSPREAIGKKIGFQSSSEGEVIGVVKNFHFRSLQSRIEPLVMTGRRFSMNYISVQVSAENIRETLTFLEESWNKHIPHRPFLYFFLNDEFDKQYRADQKVGQIFGTFTIMAIVIACLGLFGLAAYAAEQRTKEIGIRKVLGASISGIVRLLSADFLKLVLIANIVAWPVAYLAMDHWLADFAYRISIGWATFLVAGLTALLIAFVTVVYQAVRAAIGNPVAALRYE